MFIKRLYKNWSESWNPSNQTNSRYVQWTLVIVNSVLSPGVYYSACSLCYKTIAQFHQKCLLMRDCLLFRRLLLPESTVYLLLNDKNFDQKKVMGS